MQRKPRCILLLCLAVAVMRFRAVQFRDSLKSQRHDVLLLVHSKHMINGNSELSDFEGTKAVSYGSPLLGYDTGRKESQKFSVEAWSRTSSTPKDKAPTTLKRHNWKIVCKDSPWIGNCKEEYCWPLGRNISWRRTAICYTVVFAFQAAPKHNLRRDG